MGLAPSARWVEQLDALVTDRETMQVCPQLRLGIQQSMDVFAQIAALSLPSRQLDLPGPELLTHHG